MFNDSFYGGNYAPNVAAPRYSAVAPMYNTVPQAPQQVLPRVQQPAQMSTNKQFVSGVDGIKNMNLPQGVFAFFDNDRPILYDTSVDELGKKTVVAYEIKVIEPPTPEQVEAMRPVTKQDMQGLLKQIGDIQSQLVEIKKLNGGLE